jgi:TPR repeat protein
LGSAVACLHAGLDALDGVGIEKDSTRAANYLDRGCDLGDSRACNYLAVAYVKGDGVEQSWLTALTLYYRACDLGSPTACDNAGYWLLDGVFLPADLHKANELFDKGCNLPGGAGFAACLHLADSYRLGRGVAVDLSRVRFFERKANVRLTEGCDDGMPAACLQLAKHAEEGIGGDADDAKAARFRKHACDLARRSECPSPGRSCDLSIEECR